MVSARGQAEGAMTLEQLTSRKRGIEVVRVAADDAESAQVACDHRPPYDKLHQ